MKTLDYSSELSGLAPGTPYYTGGSPGRSQLSVTTYDPSSRMEYEGIALPMALELSAQENRQVTWLSVTGVSELRVIHAIGEHFKLHPLTIEDIVSVEHRPKLEFFDDYTFVLMRVLRVRGGRVHDEQLSLVLKDNTVISFQEVSDDYLDPVKERIANHRGRVRQLGPDYLFYALMDVVVDNYLVVLQHYENELQKLELLQDLTPKITDKLRVYRRDIIQLRQAIRPFRRVVLELQEDLEDEAPVFSAEMEEYLRDLQDHVSDAIESIDTFKETITELFNVYLSTLSLKTNEVMRTLTIISTIFIPLTFVVGVYGMNFQYMPELHWRFGYPLVWLIMILLSIGLIVYFKRRDWF